MSGVLDALLTRLGDQVVSTAQADRELASSDASGLSMSRPDIVVRPDCTEDVMFTVDRCQAHRVPVTPRGLGLGRAGGAIPIRGGVVLDMSAMVEIESIDVASRICRVQPGITVSALNRALAERGYFVPLGPGASTVGGVVARRGGGRWLTGYPGARGHVLGMTVVTGSAEIIRVGSRVFESSAGFDLCGALVGSEGTLAVFTEITLALQPLPVATADRCLRFGSLDEALSAAARITDATSVVSCELLGPSIVSALNGFKSYGLPAGALLLTELHAGSEAALCAGHNRLEQLGGQLVPLERDPWALMHWIPRAAQSAHPGTAPIFADVSLPQGHLAEGAALLRDLAAREGLPVYLHGAPGIGRLQAVIQADPRDLHGWDEALELRDHLVEFAIDRGGSCSGMSGVGLMGRRHMKRQHGMAIAVMQRLKQTFDPDGILNPLKLLP